MHRFLKVQILRKCQNAKYFVIFLKKARFWKKNCIAIFPTLASMGTHRKALDFMKNHVSLSIWRNRKCARDILEVTLMAMHSLHYQCTSVRSNKATQSYFFSFFCSCFSVYLLFCLCLCFFILHLVKHKEKTSKLWANLQVIEFLSFSVHRLT